MLARLGELFATGTREDWVARLRSGDTCRRRSTRCWKPLSIPTSLPTEVDYQQHGKRLKVHGSPWQCSETPAKIGIAPGLGEHNDEVLGGLGYGAAQIADLKSRKVI
jgi:crotonobetainyl-CoA:carnitine CoA-transferase CaiB-like acyl-CoA transferase